MSAIFTNKVLLPLNLSFTVLVTKNKGNSLVVLGATGASLTNNTWEDIPCLAQRFLFNNPFPLWVPLSTYAGNYWGISVKDVLDSLML